MKTRELATFVVLLLVLSTSARAAPTHSPLYGSDSFGHLIRFDSSLSDSPAMGVNPVQCSVGVSHSGSGTVSLYQVATSATAASSGTLVATFTSSTTEPTTFSPGLPFLKAVASVASDGTSMRIRCSNTQITKTGPPELDTARGLNPAHSWIHKFGYNENVGASGETIWSASVAFTGFPTTSHSVEVFSSAAADTTSGVLATGARAVVIQGLDENFNPQTSDPVSLVGTSRISVPGTWTRINRVYVTNVDGEDNGTCAAALVRPSATGVMCANVGNITVETVDTNHIMARISVGQGQTEMAVYTVPAGYTAYLKNILVTSAGTTARKGADVFMYQRQNVDDAVTPSARRVVWRAEELVGNTIQEDFGYTVSFPEKTDVWFGGTEVGGGAGTASVAATFDLLLLADPTTFINSN